MSACTQTPFLPENWSKPMPRRGRPALSEAELARTVAIYYRKGAAKAAEDIGVGVAAIYRRLKIAGVKPEHRPGPDQKVKAKRKAKVKSTKPRSVPDVDLQIAAMRQSGKTFQEIGNQLGVSRQRVHQRLARVQSAVWSPADIQHYPEA